MSWRKAHNHFYQKGLHFTPYSYWKSLVQCNYAIGGNMAGSAMYKVSLLLLLLLLHLLLLPLPPGG